MGSTVFLGENFSTIIVVGPAPSTFTLYLNGLNLITENKEIILNGTDQTIVLNDIPVCLVVDASVSYECYLSDKQSSDFVKKRSWRWQDFVFSVQMNGGTLSVNGDVKLTELNCFNCTVTSGMYKISIWHLNYHSDISRCHLDDIQCFPRRILRIDLIPRWETFWKYFSYN